MEISDLGLGGITHGDRPAALAADPGHVTWLRGWGCPETWYHGTKIYMARDLRFQLDLGWAEWASKTGPGTGVASAQHGLQPGTQPGLQRQRLELPAVLHLSPYNQGCIHRNPFCILSFRYLNSQSQCAVFLSQIWCLSGRGWRVSATRPRPTLLARLSGGFLIQSTREAENLWGKRFWSLNFPNSGLFWNQSQTNTSEHWKVEIQLVFQIVPNLFPTHPQVKVQPPLWTTWWGWGGRHGACLGAECLDEKPVQLSVF